MSAPRIRWALLGGGADSLIGSVHRAAANYSDQYQLVAGVFSAKPATGVKFAGELGLDPARSYASVEALISAESRLPEAERVRVVTVATPNNLHFAMASALIRAGINVICEKPVTTTAAEAAQLATLLAGQRLVFAVAHTYTGYPMVRQMRDMLRDGAIGAIQKVDVQYYQGWINEVIHDQAKRAAVWRLDPAAGGPSSCLGDIGIHAFNLIEYTTGIQVQAVLGDTDTLYKDNSLDVDATVLLRMGNGAKGVLCASQIATGEANNLRLAVYGRTGALKWAQEEPGVLELLQEGRPASLFRAGEPFNSPSARAAARLPPGHPEGFTAAMANIYRGVAQAVRGEHHEPGAFPTLADGVRGMRFVEAVLASVRQGSVWTTL
jgi:predicted dehydrogenase